MILVALYTHTHTVLLAGTFLSVSTKVAFPILLL